MDVCVRDIALLLTYKDVVQSPSKWYVPINHLSRKLKQETQESEASLGDGVTPSLTIIASFY